MKKIFIFIFLITSLLLCWCSLLWKKQTVPQKLSKSDLIEWEVYKEYESSVINSWNNIVSWAMLTWQELSGFELDFSMTWSWILTGWISWKNLYLDKPPVWDIDHEFTGSKSDVVTIAQIKSKSDKMLSKLIKVVSTNPSKYSYYRNKFLKLSTLQSISSYQYWLLNDGLSRISLVNLSNKNLVNFVTWINSTVVLKSPFTWNSSQIVLNDLDYNSLVEVSSRLDWFRDSSLISVIKDSNNIYTCWYPCKNKSCLACKKTDWADHRTLKALNSVFFVDDFFVYYLFIKNIWSDRQPVFMKIDWLKPKQVKTTIYNKFFLKSPIGIYYFDIYEYKVKQLDNVDKDSFVVLECNYAKDKNNVYFISEWNQNSYIKVSAISKLVSNFEVINIPWMNCFGYDSTKYFLNGNEIKLEFDPKNIDLKTLKNVNRYYKKDNKAVYYNGLAITGADSDSFYVDKKYSDSLIWFDKKSVFYAGIIYNWLSPDSIKMVWNSIFHNKLTNKDYYFLNNNWKLQMKEVFN